ncbi:MAG: metallopeptidase family protein [Clostridiales bacterium]|nr:metallopeptidase family protein [Clostridiales bacterium]
MISIKEMDEILEQLASELPSAFYKELNGGIMLFPETKRNKTLDTNDLYIMGEYHRSSALGRFITIYYGSFCKVCKHFSREQIKKELRKTLRHEFRHHVESLAGERGLEIEDARFIAEYDRKRQQRNES